MVRYQQATAEQSLTNGDGMRAGQVRGALRISHFFDFLIGCNQTVIANSRRAGFGSADIHLLRRFGPGLAATVNKSIKLAA